MTSLTLRDEYLSWVVSIEVFQNEREIIAVEPAKAANLSVEPNAEANGCGSQWKTSGWG